MCLKRFWKTGVVTEICHSNSDNEIRGVSVRINRLGQKIKWPIKNLYPLEVIEWNENMENETKNMTYLYLWKLNWNHLCKLTVKPLGLTIDHKLPFGTHVSNTCKTPSAKIKTLSRIPWLENMPDYCIVFYFVIV